MLRLVYIQKLFLADKPAPPFTDGSQLRGLIGLARGIPVHLRGGQQDELRIRELYGRPQRPGQQSYILVRFLFMGTAYVVVSGKYYAVGRNGAQELTEALTLAGRPVKAVQGDALRLFRKRLVRQEVDIVPFLPHPLGQRFCQSVSRSDVDNLHPVSFLLFRAAEEIIVQLSVWFLLPAPDSILFAVTE